MQLALYKKSYRISLSFSSIKCNASSERRHSYAWRSCCNKNLLGFLLYDIFTSSVNMCVSYF